MDRLDKVERLRERADVSYEEAKAALEAAGDDLLEAMILLEKQGKTKAPEQETYSTQYEEQKEYARVQEVVEEQEKESAAASFGHSLGRAIKTVWKLIRHTTFRVTRKENTVFAMPTWVAALILLFFWRVVIPVGILALFFGFRYTFEGLKEDTQAVNDILTKAGDFASNVEQGMNKEEKADGED